MEERAESRVAFSHMAIIAGISCLALIGVTFWQIQRGLGSGNEVSARNDESAGEVQAQTPFDAVNWQASLFGQAEAADPDGLSHIGENVVGALVGSYATMAEAGTYTPQAGEQIAEDIAESLTATISYRLYTSTEIKTDPNISSERMLAYRNDMRVALEPLLQNRDYELGLFALYVETKDAQYTSSLKKASEKYTQAVANLAKLTVPVDAADEHLEILNSLSQYGATIDRMAAFAEDAFAAAALLRTYDAAERRMFSSFEALSRYAFQKQS